MSEFEAVVRSQTDQAKRTLTVARRAGHDYEVHLDAAQIRDRLDVAAGHGRRQSGRVDPVLRSATLGE
ncbi:hypothetical protein LWC34_04340 [Kibdelosporangium philippinense]|uniref:Uncharacterized protein n=1 Tax=Kibdelosporangium philippinense TaxID=211113 RepID=A0ABS8Z3K8_9PSEU|nr:hypothetical protein [Kibdelosporangium philippinense]MCE7002057.1 hypothetical protein [Kibdelosporangium philippinense]